MTLTRVYALVWVLGIFAAVAVYLTGYMDQFTAVAFGFATFGMIFMGMMGVLPVALTHHDNH